MMMCGKQRVQMGIGLLLLVGAGAICRAQQPDPNYREPTTTQIPSKHTNTGPGGDGGETPEISLEAIPVSRLADDLHLTGEQKAKITGLRARYEAEVKRITPDSHQTLSEE